MAKSPTSPLAQEVRNVQNPGLGAMLLWRFAIGYSSSNRTSEPAPLPVLFLVLPILLHERTRDHLRSTRGASGLRAFTSKFGEASNAQQDLLVAVHDRALRLRSLSLESLSIAHATKLISIRSDGHVIALTRTAPRVGVPQSVQQLMKDAEKLGNWCGELTLHEVGVALKVAF